MTFLVNSLKICSYASFKSQKSQIQFPCFLIMSVAVAAAVYYYVGRAAFCFIESSGKQILSWLYIFAANRAESLYSWFTFWKTVRATVNVAYLVVYLTVCSKNLRDKIFARSHEHSADRTFYVAAVSCPLYVFFAGRSLFFCVILKIQQSRDNHYRGQSHQKVIHYSSVFFGGIIRFEYGRLSIQSQKVCHSSRRWFLRVS